jgi:hypothetical protein
MKMDRNSMIPGIIGFTSTLIGFFSKVFYRSFISLHRIDDYGIAGFLPSYFYVLGFSQLLLIKQTKNPLIVIAVVTLASIGFEFLQYHNSSHLDVPDIVASMFGGITSMIVVKLIKYSHS